MAEHVTWRGLTATYAEHERALMRQLATHPREAIILHELKALLEATVTRQGPTPAFDEKRNTSRVFPVAPHALEDARTALADMREQPDQLRIQP